MRAKKEKQVSHLGNQQWPYEVGTVTSVKWIHVSKIFVRKKVKNLLNEQSNDLLIRYFNRALIFLELSLIYFFFDA